MLYVIKCTSMEHAVQINNSVPQVRRKHRERQRETKRDRERQRGETAHVSFSSLGSLVVSLHQLGREHVPLARPSRYKHKQRNFLELSCSHFISCLGSDCGIVNVNVPTNGAEIGGAFGGEKETGKKKKET